MQTKSVQTESALNDEYTLQADKLADALEQATERAVGLANPRHVWYPDEVQSYFDDLVEYMQRAQKELDKLKMMPRSK